MDNRQIDALIAEKVFGWTKIDIVYRIRTSSPKGAGYPPDAEFPRRLPFYSTNLSAAWQVVEKVCSDKGLYFKMVYGWHGGVTASFDYKVVGALPRYEANASKAPLAICLAALKAVGVEVPDAT